MPIYEYICEDCGSTTEALRKMADADVQLPCESCGSMKLKRKHSVFAAGEARSEVSLPTSGGCGCGNPHGPCAMG